MNVQNFFLTWIFFVIFCGAAFAGINDSSLYWHGKTNLTSGDVRIFIYDANQGGNLVFDSVNDFNNSIRSDGSFDLLLGESRVLDLNQNQMYCAGVRVNNSDLNYGAHKRRCFVSGVGNDINVSNGSLATNGQRRLIIAEDGNVGIADATPNNTLQVGTDGALVVNNAQNRVGIGIEVPRATLHAVGTIGLQVADSDTDETRKQSRITLTHYDNDTNPMTFLYGDSQVSDSFLYIGGGTSSGNAARNILFVTGGTTTSGAGVEKMRIQSNGNVGIDDTTPDANLEVAGTFMVSSTNTGNGDRLIVISDGNVGIGDTGPQGLLDISSGKFIVTSDGNIGIGTTTPNAKLYISATTEGGASVGGIGRAITLNANQPSILLDDTSVSGPDYAIHLNESIFRIARVGNLPNDLNNDFVIISDGNIGSGLSTPTAKFHISDINGNKNIAFRVDGNSLNPTNSAFVVMSDGNVGIGTITPAAKTQIKTGANDTNALSVINSSDNILFTVKTDGNFLMRSPDGTKWNCGVTNVGTVQCI